MVKGMENIDTSVFNMGNGQTTASMVDHDSGQLSSKQDVKRNHVSQVDILDAVNVESSRRGLESAEEAISSSNDCQVENGTGAPEVDLAVGEADSVADYEDEKITRHFGQSLTFASESLKELLLLHLDLMEQQQYKLMEKDRLITQLRAEKDQLESRLTRMERRMALQKKQTGEDVGEESSGNLNKIKQSTSQIRNQSSVSSLQPVGKRARFSHSFISVNSRQVRDQGLGTYIQTESTYLHDEASRSRSEKEESKVIKNSDMIMVPNFRISAPERRGRSRSPARKHEKSTEEPLESVDDDTYFRRHQKLELDEKRRKRWDIQHTRHQRQQETLKFRQKEREVNKRSKGKKREDEGDNKFINSLMPDPEKLIAIEVSPQIPVSAFGSRIPAVQQREFNLPWFDIAKREVQLRQMKERREKREKDRQRKRSRRKNTRR